SSRFVSMRHGTASDRECAITHPRFEPFCPELLPGGRSPRTFSRSSLEARRRDRRPESGEIYGKAVTALPDPRSGLAPRMRATGPKGPPEFRKPQMDPPSAMYM